MLRAELLESRRLLATVTEFIDPNPNPGNQFGDEVVPLATGNVVITSPRDDAGGTDAGAVYLFNGSTGALISTLTGSSNDDQIGSGGVTALSNGNFVVHSPLWDNGLAGDAGAVTWGDGTNGIGGSVASANSLVGTQANDGASLDVIELTSGNYVAAWARWDNGSAADAGAVAFGMATSGVSGVVSSTNSLVGTTAGDRVGEVTLLESGNYLVTAKGWDNGNVVDAGAVAFGSGVTGVVGAVSSINSLVGSSADDAVGTIALLKSGNYVVSSPDWDSSTAAGVGAVTFGSGSTGITGVISSSNSLVGATANDMVGSVTPLDNGNYVVRSSRWDRGGIVDAGAVTLGDGITGVTGTPSDSNSLVGSSTGDTVGQFVTALRNGNFVVDSPNWDNGGTTNVGAATLVDGSSGLNGPVTPQNSLIGSTANDRAASRQTVALANGNYVVVSSTVSNAGVLRAGAVTFGNGTTGVVGTISDTNSLMGASPFDFVGIDGVLPLANGNYVVQSSSWDRGNINGAGAVTFGDGTTGVSGLINSSNSLVGSSASDRVGGTNSLTELANGNYVVLTVGWDHGSVVDVGAVTLASGTTGMTGEISSANSLVGTVTRDMTSADVIPLSNGNFVVASELWDNGSATDAGAVTHGNGTTGIVGPISASNSLVGTTADDRVGSRAVDGGITELTNGNYVVTSLGWHNAANRNAGAVTFADGNTGVTGAISSSNSLTGTNINDGVGGTQFSRPAVTPLDNGNYVVISAKWNNGALTGAGAVTLGSGKVGVTGAVNAGNSIVGLASSTALQDEDRLTVVDNVNNTYFARFLFEGEGKVRVGQQQLAPSVAQVTIDSGSGQRSIVRSITVDFDSIVTIDQGAFEVRAADGTSVTVTPTITTVNAKTRAVLTFSGSLVDASGSLIDGNYSLTILDTHIRDDLGRSLDGNDDGVAGGARVDEFFRLFGDADGNRIVNLFDFAAFRAAFGQAAVTPEIAAFDADGNGIVNLFDFAAFRSRFGKTL